MILFTSADQNRKYTNIFGLKLQSMQVGREVVRHMLFDVGMRMSKTNINFEKGPTVSFLFSITVQDFSVLSIL